MHLGMFFFVFFFKVDSFSFERSSVKWPPGPQKLSESHSLIERLGNVIVSSACCLQATAPSTLGFMSPWAGGHTDATVTMATGTERGPRRGTPQLTMEENPPPTVSPSRTSSATMALSAA